MVENGELLKDDPGQNPDPGHCPLAVDMLNSPH
jgi:hypothetical protein